MEPFKNELSKENAMCIARALKAAHSGFPMAKFQRGLAAALQPLELKGRVVHLAQRLEACLPEDPPTMFTILTKSLEGGALRGFLVWPLTEVVARRGLGHFAESMTALRELTRVFTAEFAIRPFLLAHPEQTLGQLHRWCGDPCEHVRRLVSEGSRPLLPWGMRLPHLLDAPHPTLDLLDRLHLDPSDYVRLSVSNHLNDFSKHHPTLVLETLARWKTATPDDARLDKLARHACRTLLKAGHPGALAFHGYGNEEALEVSQVALDAKQVSLGDALGYRLRIRNTAKHAVKVMFDYAIHHRKANGSLSPKVFKGKVRELAAGECWHLEGRHKLQPVTTRVYYPGQHFFEPQVNGRKCPVVGFVLRLLLLGMLIGLTLSTSAEAATIRHDVDPQAYLDEAALFPALGTVAGSGLGGSGVLISDRWVLTAGHVAFAKTGGSFAIAGTNYSVQSSTLHPSYVFGANPYDLGLLYLSAPVTGVVPAAMFRFDSPAAILGLEGTWVGRGLGGTGLTGAQALLGWRAFTNVIDVFGPAYGLTDTAFIADFDHPDGSTNAAFSDPQATRLEGNLASGDSGGGVFVEVNGVQYLVGINSFTGGFAPGTNSKYGSISGATYLGNFDEWIFDQTGIRAVPEPGVAGLFLLSLPMLFRRRRRGTV